MYYATIKTHDIANGQGVRVSLFVSGCTHKCKGCFNSEAWDFTYGQPFTSKEEEKILKALNHEYISGLSLLGGEPFEPRNQIGLLPLTRKVRQRYTDKTIWCYSGYLFEDIRAGRVGDKKAANELLSCIDVLVDGPFVEQEKNINLRFRGSENQRIIEVRPSIAQNRIILWNDRQ